MSRSDSKKHRKQIERSRQQASRKRHIEALRLAEKRKGLYPEITIAGKADPGFEELIRKAAAEMDFSDSSSFQPFERATYRALQEHGAGHAAQCLMEFSEVAERVRTGFGQIIPAHFGNNLGHQVFRRAGEAINRFLPINDVRFDIVDDRVVGTFQCLRSHRCLGGTAYYSPHLPKIEVNGTLKIVAFSRHSIERICERLVSDWATYSSLGDVFAVFMECLHFEFVELRNGQSVFTFFDTCPERPFWQQRYVEEVLGDQFDPETGRAYYRVGYCPAVVESIFFKAKTFVLPGYSATPEADLIRHSLLPVEEKRQMLRAATEMSNEGLIEGDGMAFVRWFHEHGVPQVIQTRRRIFADPMLPFRKRRKRIRIPSIRSGSFLANDGDQLMT